MKSLHTDVAIIGAGTAGLAAYRAATAAGASATIVEEGAYGTTCARVGCMPSKLLIAAAEAAHAVGKAAGFGVHIDGRMRVDAREVMQRVRRERDRFVGFVLRDLQEIPEERRLRGHARFLDDHTIVIGEHSRLTCSSAVIASGSHANRPDSGSALGERMIIADEVFEWQDLPTSLAVIGPGIIGLELGQALNRLGVRVAILGRGGRVGPIGDPAIRAQACAIFNEEFALAPDAQIASMERVGEGVTIRRKADGGLLQSERFDFVLAATGRAPNVATLGLEHTSLERDTGGVPIYDHLSTRGESRDGSCPIFIAGDAGNFIPLLHESADEGRIAGGNAAALALGQAVAEGLRRAPIAVVFTDPQIAIVGGGYKAMKAGSFAIGEASYEDQGRARILLRNKGLLHVYGDLASGRLSSDTRI